MKRNLYLVWRTIVNLLSKYSEGIIITIVIIIALVVGMSTTINIFVKPPLPVEEFQRLETIAQKIVDGQRNIDEDVSVNIKGNNSLITVSVEDGYVIAKSLNGTLTFQRVNQRDSDWVPAIFLGVLFAVVIFFVLGLIFTILEKFIESIIDNWKDAKREYENNQNKNE